MSEQPNLNDLMQQAQQLMEAQAQAAGQEIEGQSGGGTVRIKATGAGEVVSVKIDPSAVDPNDVEMLEDLVLAAIHDATVKGRELAAQASKQAGFDIEALSRLID